MRLVTLGNKGELLKQRIINSADQLFYKNGYDKTSFTDIANAVDISRGNFYYHYKSKDEILEAVIQSRLKEISTLLTSWEEQHPNPKKRICCYIDLLINNQSNIKKHGCPAGSLCMELSKVNHAMRDDAKTVMILFRNWLIKQFELLQDSQNAKQNAMHLIGRCQGISSTANTFSDTKFIKREVNLLEEWIATL